MIDRLELILKDYFYIFLFISFIISNLFFNYNSLNIAGTKNFFDTPSMNLEVEVTDGLINGNITGKYSLGRYDRSKTYSDIHPRDYKKFFKERNSEGVFNKYNTSFGFQLKFLGFLEQFLKINLDILKFINAIILSSLLIFFTYLLKNHFSYTSSATFLIVYIFSPWNISFATEIRLIQWTWILPIFFIFFFNIKKSKSILQTNILINFFVYISLLLKLLISYEFFSTIIIFLFFTQLYFCLNSKLSKKIISLQLIFLSITIILSIISSLYIHLFAFNDNELFKIFINRFYYNFNILAVNENINCDLLVTNNKLNYEYISHCVSRIEVLFRYFIFRNFLPFFGIFENYLSSELKLQLVNSMLNKNYLIIFELLSKIDLLEFASIIIILINILFFLFFTLYSFYSLFNNISNNLNILIIGSFLASISWFLLAKTYSYVHFHLCYVSWTIVFIPFASMIFIEKIYIRSKSIKKL